MKMFRGPGRSGPGRSVLGELPPNGEPPPSTLAAQLVNRFTDGKKHPKNQDQETFHQLLQEVLSSEKDNNQHDTNCDSDVKVNHKLVYVILQAGLDVQNLEDPFRARGERARQILDSIAAIEITIRRNLVVLFTYSPNYDREEGDGGPLILSLMPKLLILLVDQVEEDQTRQALLGLLSTILIAEGKTHVQGFRANSALQYVTCFVNGKYSVPSCTHM